MTMHLTHGKGQIVVIYADGACSGNPGPGGCAATLRYGSNKKIITGFLPYTTNNQMELLAAILALKALNRACEIEFYTDSKYVKGGMNSWVELWKSNGWKTAGKKPVKNLTLWQELDCLAQQHNIKWHWVKGHSGEEGNEEVDSLARQAIENKAPLLEKYLSMAEN